MTKEIAVFITNDYADWEISFICPELNHATKDFHLSFIAPTKEKIRSMGELTITPDFTIQEYFEQQQKDFSLTMLLLCDGTYWKKMNYDSPFIKELVELCVQQTCFVASICDATTFLAYHAFLNQHNHTGNALTYLKETCPNYAGQQFFIEKQCVQDGLWITANGAATLEYAKTILTCLNAKKQQQLNIGTYFINMVLIRMDK